MNNLCIPKDYKSKLGIIETQKAIKHIKDFFEENLASKLNLIRVSAPLFVKKSTGINDNLNGIEVPVNFDVNIDSKLEKIEIVQSLAKWKRIALKRYKIPVHSGIYTDMNAIRPSEIPDNTHSFYVDQWDWELVINEEDRTTDFLKSIVNRLYSVFLDTDNFIASKNKNYTKLLPDNIKFFTSQELETKYPNLTPQEREYECAKEHKAIFISNIGGALKSGNKHDNRSPDYDDWSLNGDIIFWNPILNDCLELSSMGIRVDKESLLEQLKISKKEDRLELFYHSLLINGELPFTIGGGIGQSRICMFFLQKAHIGEVQASVWPDYMIDKCKEKNIDLL